MAAKVTVEMIADKEFKKGFRGYNVDEVDIFLDDVIETFETMEAQMNTLQARLAHATQAASVFPVAPAASPNVVPAPYAQQFQTAKFAAPQPAVSADTEAQRAEILKKAEDEANEIRKRACEEADQIIEDAKVQANQILKDAPIPSADPSEAEALKNEIAALRAAARDYRARFRQLVEDQQLVLNAETVLFTDAE